MPLVTTERSGHVMTISLNRDEKLNAFNYAMLRELAEAYTELAQDKTLRVGVLRANGRYFTSGLDLGELFPELYKEAIAKAIPFFEPVKGLVPKGGVDPFGITTDPC